MFDQRCEDEFIEKAGKDALEGPIALTECDMRTPEGMARAKELDLHNKLCPKFVAFAAEAAQRLIERG